MRLRWEAARVAHRALPVRRIPWEQYRRRTAGRAGGLTAGVLLLVASCGYSEAEMQLARDRQHRLERTVDELAGQLEQCQQHHDDQEATDAGSE
jgi:hypothetical protein